MAKKIHYEPSIEEREKARDHIYYELRMLETAVNAYFDPLRSRENPHIGSAFTDSILLHVRNLYEFFCGNPSENDDIVAAHFIANKDDTTWATSKLGCISSNMKDINKFRSHITYTRTKYRMDWPRREMRDEIFNTYNEFLEKLSSDERPKWHSFNKK